MTEYRPPTAAEMRILECLIRGVQFQGQEALLTQLSGCLVRTVEGYPHDLSLKATSGTPALDAEVLPVFGQYFDEDDMPIEMDLYVDFDGRLEYLNTSRIDGKPVTRRPVEARRIYVYAPGTEMFMLVSREQDILMARGELPDRAFELH